MRHWKTVLATSWGAHPSHDCTAPAREALVASRRPGWPETTGMLRARNGATLSKRLSRRQSGRIR